MFAVHPDKTAVLLPGEYVLLTVTDSGQDIAAKHLAHIFEPFLHDERGRHRDGVGTGNRLWHREALSNDQSGAAAWFPPFFFRFIMFPRNTFPERTVFHISS